MKIIVAIHGIGDQFTCATIQSVVNIFFGCYGQTAAMPLGNLRNQLTGAQRFIVPPSPPYSQPWQNIAFAEVYWADIPRIPVKDGYTLEESRKWARTIVDRVRLQQQKKEMADLDEEDFLTLETVLEESIDTLSTLERLLFLAEKANLFKFDLSRLLLDYLGDVQVVTEFQNYREQILKQFFEVMNAVYKPDSDNEIYIVAHSEGTVIAFLGLLMAMCDDPPDWVKQEGSDWVKQVKGFMTIGSPIDKHLVLWPSLWSDLKRPGKMASEETRIKWRNYFDYGDPIGFGLDTAQKWLKENGWKAFEFKKEHNYGFSRYYLPAKAHVDYWNDKEVFGHFIENVVEPSPPILTEGKGRFKEAPKSRLRAEITGYALPYLLVSGLFFMAVYILYKAVTGYIAPNENPSTRIIAVDVAALALLLGGMTVATRIPRLTHKWFWRLSGIAFFLLTLVGYLKILEANTGSYLKIEFDSIIEGAHEWYFLGIITAIVLLASSLSKKRPAWGLKPLLLTGFLFTLAIVGCILYQGKDYEHGRLWLVFLALGGFLYLWWLAALLFDLTFIWHHYIRHSKAQEMLGILDAKTEEEPRSSDAVGNQKGLQPNLP